MKQNIEVDIPEGYEYSRTFEVIDLEGTPRIEVAFKKKNTKDFAFYVEEYLRSDYNTTNDMLCNWFDKEQLEKIGNNLKQNKLQFVPWEIKIGLLKFIAKDIHLPTIEAIKYSNSFMADGYSHMEKLHRLRRICPNKFLHDIQQ